jgi:hypothetical protein
VSSKSERRAAREAIAEYHERQLGELVHHVESAVERFRAGEVEAFDLDETILQYSRAAKELWKFCNLGNVELVASLVRDDVPPEDWWERGAPRRRRPPQNSRRS